MRKGNDKKLSKKGKTQWLRKLKDLNITLNIFNT